MLRYFRVWLLFMKTAVIREMEFRGNFFAWMIINLAWMGFTVSFFWVIYGHTDTIGGWDANQLMVLLGTFFCMEFFVWTFGYPNLGRISTYVNKGELDFFLLKPINPQFHVSLRRFSPHNTASLVPAAGMLLIGLRGMGLTLSLGQMLLYAILFVAGLLIFYSLWFMSITLIYWTTRTHNIQELFLTVLQVQRMPPEVFGAAGRFLITFIVPISIVTVFPARVLMGTLQPELAAYMLGAAVFLLWFSNRFWNFALRRYASASS